jgi:hypothetical protein
MKLVIIFTTLAPGLHSERDCQTMNCSRDRRKKKDSEFVFLLDENVFAQIAGQASPGR